MATALRAYHGDPELKAKLLAGLDAHAAADRIVKGQYWDDGKGCAIGCTLETFRQIKGLPIRGFRHGDYSLYGELMGVPARLGAIEDALFEALPNGRAVAWPRRFSDSLVPGADYSRVADQWFRALLVDPKIGVVNCTEGYPDCRAAVEAMGELYRRRLSHPLALARFVAVEAAGAAGAARTAWAAWAAEAAWAAGAARAARAAWAAEAAWAAGAAGAARAARAAWAAWAAEAAGAAGAAEERERIAIAHADKLIDLIGAASLAEAA